MNQLKVFKTGVFLFSFVVCCASTSVRAADLICPDTGDDLHHKDVMATSAPEIKTRAANQDDAALWAKIVKPLTVKAIKLAKTQRSAAMEDGIERACSAPQIYVGQVVSVPDTASGCDHRILTRPADADHIYVQVIATCKYDWSCCTPKDSKSSRSVGFSLEGPLNPNPTPASKDIKH